MTTIQIALFRGINVGKAKRVSMADLKATFEALGFERVRTLLNSGNVVFDAGRSSPTANVARIAEALFDRTEVSAQAMVIRSERLSEIIAANPFARRIDEPSSMLIGVFAEAVDVSPFKALEPMAGGNFHIGEHACYLWCPGGILESPVADKLLGAKFRDLVTTRNWTTMLKLQAMAAN